MNINQYRFLRKTPMRKYRFMDFIIRSQRGFKNKLGMDIGHALITPVSKHHYSVMLSIFKQLKSQGKWN